MRGLDAPVLRPLGVGDVVDRVFNLYRSSPLLFVALAAIPYLLLFLVLGAMALGLAGPLSPLVSLVDSYSDRSSVFRSSTNVPIIPPDKLASMLAAAGVFFLGAALAAIVLLSAQSAALIEAVAARYLSRKTSIGAALRAGIAVTPRVIFSGIAVFFAYVLLWFALILVFVLTSNVLVVIAGVLLGLVASIYLIASWLLTPVVATLERVGPIAALGRAWSLSEGHRWRILGLQLLLVILQVVVSGLLSVVLIFGFIGDRVALNVVQTVLNVVSTIVWAPVEWAAFTVFYFDLRVRKEALDLQLAAEALPHEQP